MDVKVTADPQREKEILQTVDPFIKDWIAALRDALQSMEVKISINITGLPTFGASAKQLPDAPQPKE